MAAFTPHQRRPMEVIDLVSSDDDHNPRRDISRTPAAARQIVQVDADSDTDSNSDSDSVRYATPPPNMASETPGDDLLEEHVATPDPQRRPCGSIVIVDGEEIFIPDENEAPAQTHANMADNTNMAYREVSPALNSVQVVTSDTCLQRVLEIFPDISHEYVLGLYNDFDREGDYETLPGPARLDNILEQLVSASSYPKQDKGKKRKREDSMEEDSFQQWERADRVAVPNWVKGSMQAILKAEFPDIPVQYINNALATHRHLYQTFIALAKTQDGPDHTSRPYGRGRPPTKHNLADATTIADGCGWPELLDELNTARKRVQIIRSERAAEEVQRLAEQENLRLAIAGGETAECSACFDDLPMNRQIHCNGPKAHFLCFDCAETYIKSEIGESRCRVVCPAENCDTGYASHQLNLLSDKQSLQRLAQLQQEKDIRDAGLDNLEECPFCDYKAILPPIEEDFEFRCANSECEKVSCRRCKAISHIPISCEQHAKDNKINSRHKIEEAMTAALVRSCNKCKNQFIKEYGCNKMTCPSCGNLQCYVCSATLKDYNHFDQNPGRAPGAGGNTNRSKLCPLYDNVEERHEREVKEAEAKAREEVVQENPDVTAEDLEIKVSEAVKTATANRVRQGDGHDGPALFPFAAAFRHAAVPGLFGVFDGAHEDGGFIRHFPNALPPHANARAAARRRFNDARLLAELQMQNAAQPGVVPPIYPAAPYMPPPPPPQRPYANVPLRRAVPVPGYAPPAPPHHQGDPQAQAPAVIMPPFPGQGQRAAQHPPHEPVEPFQLQNNNGVPPWVRLPPGRYVPQPPPLLQPGADRIDQIQNHLDQLMEHRRLLQQREARLREQHDNLEREIEQDVAWMR